MGKIMVVLILLMVVIMMKPPKIMTSVEALSNEDMLATEFLNVPASIFTDTLRTTIEGMLKVASIMAKFSGAYGDFRVSNAISDCLDLLELSSDELDWTLSTTQQGRGNGTGDLAADLKTWLSASLINQATCLEGFDGTRSIVKGLVSGSINQVSMLVQQVLHMVHQPPHPTRSSNSRWSSRTRPSGGRRLMTKVDDEDEFPSWIRSKDRKLLQSTVAPTPNVVVALDGSGDFAKIMDAIDASPSYSKNRFIIYVKKGVYDEIVVIKRKKTNIMIYGDGMDVTVITGNHSVADGWTTYRSATFGVTGMGFIARDMTFINTAGPLKNQAVAFRSDSDLSALYRCAFRGYQDTLYAHANRQFFRECTITGTVDFLFGDAVAVFQSCLIQSRQGLPNQKNTITAQGRKDPGENTGFSLQFCNITGESNPVVASNTSSNSTLQNTYLGRPWRPYSRTVIMQSYISGVVRPEGWLEWSGNLYLDTLTYAEYMNYGPGAALGSRVKWPGYSVFNSSAQAINYTVAQFIDGNMWLPNTGVRFASGLSAV